MKKESSASDAKLWVARRRYVHWNVQEVLRPPDEEDALRMYKRRGVFCSFLSGSTAKHFSEDVLEYDEI